MRRGAVGGGALAVSASGLSALGFADAAAAATPSDADLAYLRLLIAAELLVFDFQSRMEEFYREMGQLVASGAVKAQETVVEGLEGTPDAFLGLFQGANIGKMLVKL